MTKKNKLNLCTTISPDKLFVGALTLTTIVTGTNDSGDTSNWAMKLTKISDSTITYNPNNLSITNSYDNYNVIPSTLTKVVEYKDTNTNNSSSTDQTKGAHIETTYAAYIASTQPADTYNGKVKYLLVHPANFTTGTYSVSYNANGGTGTMDTETGINNYEPHTLVASTLTAPTGYMLAGWCDTQDTEATAQNPQTSCAGTSYADQATIPASTMPTGSTMTLYAYWEKLPTYSIYYNANGGTGTMEETYILTYEPHTLAASTLTPPVGYKLSGWCSEQDTTATAENPQTTCAGESYATDATIPANTMVADSILVLYAYWEKVFYMQDVSNWKNTLSVGDEMVAVDERDGTEYYVAKLADNNIWMVQNLDLDLDDQTTLTPATSNVSSN